MATWQHAAHTHTDAHYTYILKSNNHISIANDPVVWAWQHKKLHFVISQRTFRSTKGPKDKKKLCALCAKFFVLKLTIPSALSPYHTLQLL